MLGGGGRALLNLVGPISRTLTVKFPGPHSTGDAELDARFVLYAVDGGAAGLVRRAEVKAALLELRDVSLLADESGVSFGDPSDSNVHAAQDGCEPRAFDSGGDRGAPARGAVAQRHRCGSVGGVLGRCSTRTGPSPRALVDALIQASTLQKCDARHQRTAEAVRWALTSYFAATLSLSRPCPAARGLRGTSTRPTLPPPPPRAVSLETPQRVVTNASSASRSAGLSPR